MEKKTIQVGVLKTVPAGETPSGPKAKGYKAPPAEAEVGGRYAQVEHVECPYCGGIFRAIGDTDYWVTVECPYCGGLCKV